MEVYIVLGIFLVWLIFFTNFLKNVYETVVAIIFMPFSMLFLLLVAIPYSFVKVLIAAIPYIIVLLIIYSLFFR